MSGPAQEPIDPVVERLEGELALELRRELLEVRRGEAAAGGSRLPLAEAIVELVERRAVVLATETRRRLAERIRRETVGLGPLEPLLADPTVDEILVNGSERVFVERAGRLEETGARFAGEGELRDVIERVLAPTGRRVDELQPMADGRLPDGSRVNVVIPPLAVDGPSLSIRRFGHGRLGVGELIERKSLAPELAALLEAAVRGGSNLIVSGGTGSGKTTFLNALSGFIAPGERVITVEDAAELRLAQPHVVRLETRTAGLEGRGTVSVRDLVRNALRMRPDRLIVGEVRGAEAIDLMAALNTGHRGSLSTVHANSSADAMARLETLAMMSEVGLSHRVVAEQLARAIDLVLHLERGPDGHRRAIELVAVGWDGEAVTVEPVWGVTRAEALGPERPPGGVPLPGGVAA